MQRWAFSFITSNNLVPHITTSQLEVTCGPSAQPLLFLPGLQTATENLNLCNTCIEDMGFMLRRYEADMREKAEPRKADHKE